MVAFTVVMNARKCKAYKGGVSLQLLLVRHVVACIVIQALGNIMGKYIAAHQSWDCMHA